MAKSSLNPTSTTLTDGAMPIPSAQETPSEVPIVGYDNMAVPLIRPINQYTIPHHFLPENSISHLSLNLVSRTFANNIFLCSLVKNLEEVTVRNSSPSA